MAGTASLVTLKDCWDRISSVRSGHFAVYYPGSADPPNTLIIYNTIGREVARQSEAMRAFDLLVNEDTGELVVIYIRFQDGSDRPTKRWNTGIVIPKLAAPAPSTPPATRTEIVAEIKRLVDVLATTPL